jgi:hypothetical protein
VTVAARALREASSAAVLARKALRLIAMSVQVPGPAGDQSTPIMTLVALMMA